MVQARVNLVPARPSPGYANLWPDISLSARHVNQTVRKINKFQANLKQTNTIQLEFQAVFNF